MSTNRVIRDWENCTRGGWLGMTQLLSAGHQRKPEVCIVILLSWNVTFGKANLYAMLQYYSKWVNVFYVDFYGQNSKIKKQKLLAFGNPSEQRPRLAKNFPVHEMTSVHLQPVNVRNLITDHRFLASSCPLQLNSELKFSRKWAIRHLSVNVVHWNVSPNKVRTRSGALSYGVTHDEQDNLLSSDVTRPCILLWSAIFLKISFVA